MAEHSFTQFDDALIIPMTGTLDVDRDVVRDGAVLEDEHTVGKHHGLLDVVSHEQRGESVCAPQPCEQCVRFDPGERIECTEWFVEQ